MAQRDGTVRTGWTMVSWVRVVALTAVLGPTVIRCADFREDEFDCEEAAATIQQCCPGVNVAQLQCTYSPGGCGATAVLPELSIAESTCITGRTCAQMADICTRINERIAAVAVMASMPPPATGCDPAFAHELDGEVPDADASEPDVEDVDSGVAPALVCP